jgi:hypothetical protein
VDTLLSPPPTVTPPPEAVSPAPGPSRPRPRRPPNPFLLDGPYVDRVAITTTPATAASTTATTTSPTATTSTAATTTTSPTATTSTASVTANQLFQATLPQERVQTQRPGRNRTADAGAAAAGEPAPRRRRLANSAAVGQYLQVNQTKVLDRVIERPKNRLVDFG